MLEKTLKAFSLEEDPLKSMLKWLVGEFMKVEANRLILYVIHERLSLLVCLSKAEKFTHAIESSLTQASN